MNQIDLKGRVAVITGGAQGIGYALYEKCVWKNGHMANNHAKVAAAAIVAELAGVEINPAPMLTNTCYSFVDDRRVMHVASVHAWAPAQKTYLAVPNSGGLSAAASEQEGRYALSWAHNIWADALS